MAWYNLQLKCQGMGLQSKIVGSLRTTKGSSVVAGTDFVHLELQEGVLKVPVSYCADATSIPAKNLPTLLLRLLPRRLLLRLPGLLPPHRVLPPLLSELVLLLAKVRGVLL